MEPRFIAAALALVMPTGFAAAQSGFSAEVGVLTAPGEGAGAVLQVGLRVVFVQTRSVGVDFAIATIPEGIVEGVLLLTPDFDLTAAIPLGLKTWLLPRGGVSALVGVGGGAAGAVLGFNVGVGILGAIGASMGARLDVGYRRYISDGETAGLLGVSVGVGWMF